MGPDQLVFFWLILSTIGICVMIFGIKYLNNRENMALIEKGMDPKTHRERPRPVPFRNLKWGLLMVGAGLGLFLAYILDNFVLYNIPHGLQHEDANVPIYFAMIAIGGGVGLILSYRIERNGFPPDASNA